MCFGKQIFLIIHFSLCCFSNWRGLIISNLLNGSTSLFLISFIFNLFFFLTEFTEEMANDHSKTHVNYENLSAKPEVEIRSSCHTILTLWVEITYLHPYKNKNFKWKNDWNHHDIAAFGLKITHINQREYNIDKMKTAHTI